jgi:hypothetical protein
MEVRFAPELQAKIDQLVADSGFSARRARLRAAGFTITYDSHPEVGRDLDEIWISSLRTVPLLPTG